MKLLMIGMVVGLIAASCGGSSDDAGTSGTDASTTTTAASSESTTTAAGASTETTKAPDTSGDETSATVTIDGVAYVFGDNAAPATCTPDFFGGFFAVLYSEDASANFEVELWNEGTGDGERLPTAGMNIEVDGEILDLEANPETSWPAAEAGTSYVGPFTYEGNTASGTIHFINTEVAYNADLAPLDPIIAEFEVVCADD